MKKALFILAISAMFFTSCAVHSGLTTNSNLSSTEVVLSKNNFKIIESVQGSSEAIFILGIGGLTKDALISEARNNMLSTANIIGNSRAIINERVEVKHSLFPLVRHYKVIVSGHVIEFTE